MGKIIGLSLLQCEIERGCFSPPPYDSFISLITNIIPTKNRKVQFIDIPKKNKSSRCIIQSVYEDFVILLRYSNYLPSDSYDVIKVPTNTLSDEVANNESQQIITLSSNCFSPSNGMRQLSCNFHRLDQNRALFHNPMQFVGSNGKQQYTDYIAVLSVSNGLVWEASYPGERSERLIFMPEHNLFAILYSEWPIIVVISLLDGSIKHKIGIDFSLDKFSNFERCFDTLIVGYYLKASQYCIVNLATGQHSIHLFPISNVTNCKPTFGHMLIRNSNELQAISFVPEPI
ncbi:hypothetical protein BDF19DRAFT_413267 [Syncephalis fuscata]|nr:hypothetical protein BDF19DRAFT_413267 [Syncephalis fuscata]